MTKLKGYIHKKAFLTHFEIACEFGALICLTDLFWLSHDIMTNGLNIHYIIVGIGLSIGLIGTLWVLIKHHKAYTHRAFKKLKDEKLEKLQCNIKCKSRRENRGNK